MAKQYKKLQQKIYPKKEAEPPKEKIGKDYFLLGVIAFVVIVSCIGWEQFDNSNRAMYLLLSVSLCLTYARRHFNLPERAQKIVDILSMVTIAVAFFIFIIIAYNLLFG